MRIKVPKFHFNPKRNTIILWGILALSIWGVFSYQLYVNHKPLPEKLQLIFNPNGKAGDVDPLLVAGAPDSNDCLFIHYLDNENALIGYDCGQIQGPRSSVFHLANNIEHSLTIESPALTDYDNSLTYKNSPLKVSVDRNLILYTDIQYHPRNENKIFIGYNPNGQKIYNEFLHGTLKYSDNKLIPEQYTQKENNKQYWIKYITIIPRRLIIPSLIIILIAYFLEERRKYSNIYISFSKFISKETYNNHSEFVITFLVCVLIFSLFITKGTFSFFETDILSTFYDYQASSLLNAHLDVPRQAILFEAYVCDGKNYGYFGITPALIRIPFALLGIGFGKITRLLMTLEYAGILVSSYALFLYFKKYLTNTPTYNRSYIIYIWMFNIGLGSTVLFLSSRAIVYHEAILCGIFFSILTAVYTYKYYLDSKSHAWIQALIFCTLTVNSRPTMAVFSCTLIGVVTLWHLKLYFLNKIIIQNTPFKNIIIGLLVCISFLTANIIYKIKFHSYEGPPAKNYVLYNPERSNRTLGKPLHLSNVQWGLNAYVWGANLQAANEPPFLFVKWPNPKAYPEAKIDHIEPIVPITYTMSGLLVLCIIGIIYIPLYKTKSNDFIIFTIIATIPIAIILITAAFQSERYKADFVPAFIIISAIAILRYGTTKIKAHYNAAIFLITMWSIYINLAITLQYAKEPLWSVPKQVRNEWTEIVKKGY